MINKLKIISYNIQGFSSVKFEHLQNLCENNDIIIVQEHWLPKNDSQKFDQHLLKIRSHVVSGMDCSVITAGKPCGGTAIIWKDSILMTMTPINTVSKRVSVVKVIINDVSIVFFSVYMSDDNVTNTNLYGEILDEISSVLSNSTDEYFIIAGDFNVDLGRNSLNLKLLKSFISYHELEILTSSKHCNIDYTFESKANGSQSLFDHFVVSQNVLSNVKTYSVVHSVDNLSDHSPIQVVLNNMNIPYETFY